MISPIFDLRKLRYFRTIASRGSLSGAARALNVSQPALTHHMHELELALGAPVFERSPRGIALTEAGRVLLRRAEIILGEVASAEAELRDFVRSRSHLKTITIAMTHSLASSLASHLMAKVSGRLPTFALRIASEPDNDCHELIERGDCDFAVMFARPNRPRAVPLCWQQLFLVTASSSGAGATWQPITFKEMVREPLILPSTDSELRPLIEEVANSAGLTVNVVAEMHGVVPRKQAVIDRLGCTILPWQVVSAECEAGLLVARPVVDPKLERLIVGESRTGIDPAIASIVVDITRKAVAQVYDH